MALVGPLKRLFRSGRPAYKRVASTSSRRQSDPPPPDLEEDNDPYNVDDDVAHGPFVYSAFLMLGKSSEELTANM
jgi:hypothetical protein